MSKHSDGPWYENKVTFRAIMGADGRLVANMPIPLLTHRSEGEIKANRRLIVAAPELLDACRLAFQRLKKKSETCKDSEWKAADQVVFEALSLAIKKAVIG